MRAFDFFFEHAGWSYDPQTESEFAGRVRCALELEHAEACGADHGFEFDWEPDNDTRAEDFDAEVFPPRDDEESWRFWGCILRYQGKERDSLWGISFASNAPSDEPYARVVEAELASELLFELDREESALRAERAAIDALHPTLRSIMRRYSEYRECYPAHLRGNAANEVYAAICEGIHHTFGHCRVLAIDAWRDDRSWTWNNWHLVGWFPLALIDATPRVLLRELRERGFLSATSGGLVRVDDDGYNIVIEARHTGEPLIALEYGQ